MIIWLSVTVTPCSTFTGSFVCSSFSLQAVKDTSVQSAKASIIKNFFIIMINLFVSSLPKTHFTTNPEAFKGLFEIHSGQNKYKKMKKENK
jgi:hypothetical protein